MAILPARKNPAVLVRDFERKMRDRTNINNFDRNSKAKSIIDNLAEESATLRDETVSVFRANQVSSATGADLDNLGSSRGVTRGEATFAYSNSTDQNFMFYVDTGTFGSVNSNSSITIPRGTIMRSLPNNNEQGAVIEFVVQSEAVLGADAGIAYVDVRAKDLGIGSNVGRSVIIDHNFTNYTASGNKSLKCTNIYPVVNGRNRDTDDLYRFKISQRYDSLVESSRANLQLQALDIPGVRDLRILPGYYGIGSVAVVVLGVENEIDSSLLRLVASRLQDIAYPGANLQALPAVKVEIDVVLEVRVIRDLTAQQKLVVENQVRIALRDYFRQVGIGGYLDLTSASDFINRRATSMTMTKADPKNIGLFQKVFVRKGFSGGISSERQKIIVPSWDLENDEYAALGTLEIKYIVRN